MTTIIATIGPASDSTETLKHFKDNSVTIARLNGSHNNGGWHLETAEKAKQVGLSVLFDLPGPKLRLGRFNRKIEIQAGEYLALEERKPKKRYPYVQNGYTTIPVPQELLTILDKGELVLIDDGSIAFQVYKKNQKIVVLKALNRGKLNERKSVNLPQSELEISFLSPKDIDYIEYVIPRMKPEYVAISFVKNVQDISCVKEKIATVLASREIKNYYPKIVAKIETQSAVQNNNLPAIIKASDLVMIARGDLALETQPNHMQVPFLQEIIIEECERQSSEYIVATQMLESMTASVVPTRAEVSDLYRAIDRGANYVMLSAETATGENPRETVRFIHNFVEMYKKQKSLS